MPFEGLGDKLQSAFKDLRGKGKLSESDIDAALREVRRALLEADVNFKVAKDFIAHVREKAMGEEVFGSLKPDQTVIKIVRDELTELLGGTQSKITLSSTGMTVIMLVGLQGAGKTTTAGKLALMFKKKGHRPMLAACDVYRPAAIKQLEVLGEQTDVPVTACLRMWILSTSQGTLSTRLSHTTAISSFSIPQAARILTSR